MLFKFLTMAAVLLAALFLARRAFGARPAQKSRGGAPKALERCPSCGAYRAAGDLCDCEKNPTP